MTYDDGNFYEVAQEAERHIAQGNIVFQKWTCSFCGERISMSIPNRFFKKGKHEDCKIDANSDTDLIQQGCNYLLVQANSLKAKTILSDLRQNL